MDLELSARLIFAGCALLVTAGILVPIRNGDIKEKYALLWLPLGIFFMVFGSFPSMLLWVSHRVHLHYITVVLLCVIIVFTYILLYITMRLSQMREDMKRLAQELALIKERQFSANEPADASASWSVGSLEGGEASPLVHPGENPDHLTDRAA